METNIWQKLTKPIFILAPMEEVTDAVFRQIVARCGKPDLFFTEFTSVEGMQSRGREKVVHRLRHGSPDVPIVAQIWGLKPEAYLQSAQEIRGMGFVGIDINMGCPVKKVVQRGACSGLIRNPGLAKEIIAATKEGAGNLPVSVKTRIGIKDIETQNWLGFLLDQEINALIVHGRTVKERSAVPAHWDEIAKVVALRNQKEIDTVIIGNGDVKSVAEGKEKCQTYGVDGVMVGRGIFGNPWLFNEAICPGRVSIQDRIGLLLEHARLFERTWGKTKNFAILRRFFKIYVKDFAGAHELCMQLNSTTSLAEVEKIIANSPFLMYNRGRIIHNN